MLLVSFVASKSLKLSFTLSCVLGVQTSYNDFELTRLAFNVRRSFEAFPRE